MKVGIATSLSVVGVLAAGAAAFALNTAVLSESPSDTMASAAQATIATGGAATATTAPAGGVGAGGDVTAAGDSQAGSLAPITPGSTKVSNTVTTYKVGDAGSVVIDTASGAIAVTDVVPAAGWTAEPARIEANGLVKVHFVKGSTRLEFTAQMSNGAVAVNVTTETKPTPSTPKPGVAPSIPRSISGGDDDDDDEHEDHEDGEDHEDEDDD